MSEQTIETIYIVTVRSIEVDFYATLINKKFKTLYDN